MEIRFLCRFLDAGNDERLLALRRPASKKRQGTKSREVGHWLSSERYGDLILTPAMMVGALLEQGDLVGARQGAWERATGISVVVGPYKRAIGWLIGVIVPREIAAGVAPAHRNSKFATLTSRHQRGRG